MDHILPSIERDETPTRIWVPSVATPDHNQRDGVRTKPEAQFTRTGLPSTPYNNQSVEGARLNLEAQFTRTRIPAIPNNLQSVEDARLNPEAQFTRTRLPAILNNIQRSKDARLNSEAPRHQEFLNAAAGPKKTWQDLRKLQAEERARLERKHAEQIIRVQSLAGPDLWSTAMVNSEGMRKPKNGKSGSGSRPPAMVLPARIGRENRRKQPKPRTTHDQTFTGGTPAPPIEDYLGTGTGITYDLTSPMTNAIGDIRNYNFSTSGTAAQGQLGSTFQIRAPAASAPGFTDASQQLSNQTGGSTASLPASTPQDGTRGVVESVRHPQFYTFPRPTLNEANRQPLPDYSTMIPAERLGSLDLNGSEYPIATSNSSPPSPPPTSFEEPAPHKRAASPLTERPAKSRRVEDYSSHAAVDADWATAPDMAAAAFLVNARASATTDFPTMPTTTQAVGPSTVPLSASTSEPASTVTETLKDIGAGGAPPEKKRKVVLESVSESEGISTLGSKSAAADTRAIAPTPASTQINTPASRSTLRPAKIQHHRIGSSGTKRGMRASAASSRPRRTVGSATYEKDNEAFATQEGFMGDKLEFKTRMVSFFSKKKLGRTYRDGIVLRFDINKGIFEPYFGIEKRSWICPDMVLNHLWDGKAYYHLKSARFELKRLSGDERLRVLFEDEKELDAFLKLFGPIFQSFTTTVEESDRLGGLKNFLVDEDDEEPLPSKTKPQPAVNKEG